MGYRLKVATAALHAEMEAVLRPLGLNITQYSTLEQLAQRPGVAGSDLARGTFVTRQSMSAVLQSLVSEGLISRAETATHGRALPVRLTDEGRRRLGDASAAVRAVEDRMLSGLTREDEDRLRGLLDRCVEGLREQGPAQ